jgi:hypothetical protein
LAVVFSTGALLAAFFTVVFFAAAGFFAAGFAAAGFFPRAAFFTVCFCRCAGTVCDASASVSAGAETSACSTGAPDGVSDALPDVPSAGSPVCCWRPRRLRAPK